MLSFIFQTKRLICKVTTLGEVSVIKERGWESARTHWSARRTQELSGHQSEGACHHLLLMVGRTSCMVDVSAPVGVCLCVSGERGVPTNEKQRTALPAWTSRAVNGHEEAGLTLNLRSQLEVPSRPRRTVLWLPPCRCPSVCFLLNKGLI